MGKLAAVMAVWLVGCGGSVSTLSQQTTSDDSGASTTESTPPAGKDAGAQDATPSPEAQAPEAATLEAGDPETGDPFEASVDACQPATCQSLGFTCGTASDGCGGSLNCGTCGASALCTANICQVPVATDGGPDWTWCPPTTACSNEALTGGGAPCGPVAGQVSCLASAGYCCYQQPQGNVCILYGPPRLCQ